MAKLRSESAEASVGACGVHHRPTPKRCSSYTGIIDNAIDNHLSDLGDLPGKLLADEKVLCTLVDPRLVLNHRPFHPFLLRYCQVVLRYQRCPPSHLWCFRGN